MMMTQCRSKPIDLLRFITLLVVTMLLVGLTGCDSLGEKELSFPQRIELERAAERGRLTGDGLNLFGGDPQTKSGVDGTNPLGVNAFLWRATLDTLAFLPLRDADPFGGVIITDWYEDPQTRGERYKVTAMILDRALRADGVKISLFKQRRAETGEWSDVEVADKLERQLEDTILTRARELRIKSL